MRIDQNTPLHADIVRLEELDKRKIEPQPIFLPEVIGGSVVLVNEFEHRRTDVSESRVFAETEDAGDELIGTDTGLEDWVEGFAVGKEGSVLREERGRERGGEPSDGASRLAVVFVADSEEKSAETLNDRVDAGRLSDRLNEL
jgi:hypothetical protein